MRNWRRSGFVAPIIWFVCFALLSLQVSPAFALGFEASRRSAERESMKLHYGLPAGLTQTLTPKQLAVIDARKHTEAAKKRADRLDVRKLTVAEMRQLRGSGPYRNHYYAGQTPPWQRSFHDVNVCNGNLFKNFTDMQIAPARGAGLVLNRSYSSDDPRIGPFGVGWTHAYDIRNIEDGNNTTDVTGFFGRSDTYHRDADGLYSAPAFKHDILDSDYGTTLVNGQYPPTADTDTGLDGTVKHYFTNGNERDCDYIQDRHGNTTNLTYDPNTTLPDGRHPLVTVTDPSCRSIQFTWANVSTTSNPAWRITQVQGPLVNGAAVQGVTYRVTYQYYTDTTDPNAADDLYNLKSVTLDPDGLNRTTSYTYTHVTDSNGVQENALLASITDPLLHVVSYSYFIPNSSNSYIAPGSTYNATAWVNGITEPAGVDQSGNPRTEHWTLDNFSFNGSLPGQVALDVYDAQNLGISIVYTDFLQYTGLSVVGGQDAQLPTGVYSVTTVYNRGGPDCGDGACGYGHLSDSIKHQYIYDIHGTQVGRYSDPYTAIGTQSNNQSQLTNADIYTDDANGRVLTHQAFPFTPLDTTAYYGVSEYFEKQTETDMNGHVTTSGYGTNTDPNLGNRGSVLWVQDARYSVTGKQTTYTYNQYGQKLTETNENGTVTQYTYGDQFGNLTQVVQDPGDSTHLNRTTSMTYDAAGRVLTSTDPSGNTTTFTYNVLGQPLTVSTVATANTPAETISYQYDTNGRTLNVTDNRGTTTISYEAGSDRVHSVTDPVTGTTTYTYKVSGEKASVTLPGGGTWTYNYLLPADSVANSSYSPSVNVCEIVPDDISKISLSLASIVDDQGRAAYYNISCEGVLVSMSDNYTYTSGSNPQVVSYNTTTYSNDYQMGTSPWLPYTHHWITQAKTTFTNNGTSTTIAENDYAYDNIGQRLTNAITNNTGATRTETYGYDEVNRLTSVNYGDGETQSYQFDPMGNRQEMTDTVSGAATTHNYSYDAANRLTALDSGTYTNDANGNTLTGGGRTNTWDSQNRLTQCVYTSGSTTNTSNFTYGADGYRHRAVVNDGTTTTTTDYVLDGDNAVRELRSGVSYATYLTGVGGPVYKRYDQSGAVSWYVYDGLGSVIAEVSPTGTVTCGNKYDVYGAVRGRAGTSTTSHGFVGALGHMSEANTGLIYMRARYYDPTIGRFASEDPGRSGKNWYCYANDNPVCELDQNGQDGENPWDEFEFALHNLMTGGLLGLLKNWENNLTKFFEDRKLAKDARAAKTEIESEQQEEQIDEAAGDAESESIDEDIVADVVEDAAQLEQVEEQAGLGAETVEVNDEAEAFEG